MVTLFAIGVALTTARTEREHGEAVRAAERRREKDAQSARTARLAHAFGQELTRGSSRLARAYNALGFSLRVGHVEPAALDTAIALMARGLEDRSLVLIDRFANDLDGFSEMDGIAILNMLSNWRHVTGPAVVYSEIELTNEQKRDQIEKRRKDFSDLHGLMRELQLRMEPYFKHVPGIQIIEPETGLGTEAPPRPWHE